LKLENGFILAERPGDLTSIGTCAAWARFIMTVWDRVGWGTHQTLRSILCGQMFYELLFQKSIHPNENTVSLAELQERVSLLGPKQRLALRAFLKTWTQTQTKSGKHVEPNLIITGDTIRPSVYFSNLFEEQTKEWDTMWLQAAPSYDLATLRKIGIAHTVESVASSIYGGQTTLRQMACWNTLLYHHALRREWVKLSDIGDFLGLETTRVGDTLEPFMGSRSSGRIVTRKSPLDKRKTEIQFVWPGDLGDVYLEAHTRWNRIFNEGGVTDISKLFGLPSMDLSGNVAELSKLKFFVQS
jgi:hypothetical protein